MLKSKKSSAPKKVRKISTRTAKRRISNGSAANRKMVAKRKKGIRKANYNSRNIRNANWVYKPNTPVGGIRGALYSAVLIMTIFFGKRSGFDFPVNVSQTDGKKATRKAGKGKTIFLISLSKNNPILVMLTLPKSNRIITALLKMPKSYKLRGDWARARINACSDNVNIVILPATITAYLALLAIFVTAQTNMQNGTKGNKPIRDDAWVPVENAMKSLLAVAQANANASPSTAVAIIESGLFSVKSVAVIPGTVFKATNSNTLGNLNFKAPGAPRAANHIFEKSVDGVTWITLGTVRYCKMTYGGFTPVSKVWVRHRTDLNGVLSAWEYFYVTVN